MSVICVGTLLLIGAWIKQTSSCPSMCDCAYYNSIHTMECNSQDLYEIPGNIPEWTTFLEVDANYLTKLDLNFCNICIYFEDLSFRYNSIKTIKIIKNGAQRLMDTPLRRCNNVATIFPRVVNINLKGNLLETLPKCFLFVLPVLKILKLDLNKIRNINDLNFADYHPSTNSLEELYLRSNRITQLMKKDMYSRTLPLRRLRVFDLSSNKIHTIESGVFTFLDELTEIYLNNNRLGFLNNFVFVTRGEKLETISLRRNFIDWISPHTFAGLPNLKSLDLSHNEISCLLPDTFSTCQFINLETGVPGLNFVDHETAHFHMRFKVHFTKMQRLELNSNKWHCDCQLSRMIPERLVLKNLLKCYSPIEHQNKTISSILGEMSCPET